MQFLSQSLMVSPLIMIGLSWLFTISPSMVAWIRDAVLPALCQNTIFATSFSMFFQVLSWNPEEMNFVGALLSVFNMGLTLAIAGIINAAIMSGIIFVLKSVFSRYRARDLRMPRSYQLVIPEWLFNMAGVFLGLAVFQTIKSEELSTMKLLLTLGMVVLIYVAGLAFLFQSGKGRGIVPGGMKRTGSRWLRNVLLSFPSAVCSVINITGLLLIASRALSLPQMGFATLILLVSFGLELLMGAALRGMGRR